MDVFVFPRQVHFYETDLMGIVHHSNYVRFLEEARVAWAFDRKILSYAEPESARALAAVEVQVKYLRPSFFGDKIEIDVASRLEGVRIYFNYRLRNLSRNNVGAFGRSVHASVDGQMRLLRPPSRWKEIMEKEQWIETWP